MLPGIGRVSEKELKVAYDPALVLRRFTDRFNLPDSVSASVKDGVLILAGEAPHAWLTRVRRGAPGVPGITTIDEEKLIDLDQRAFQQSKSVIESAFVYRLLYLTFRDSGNHIRVHVLSPYVLVVPIISRCSRVSYPCE